jgi:hypothetical protein
MLMNHPNAMGDRIVGAFDLDGLSVDHDASTVRTIEPIQDVHQRRLAGPVLAEQRMDLAGAYIEAHIVVGDDVPEPPRDMNKLYLGQTCALEMDQAARFHQAARRRDRLAPRRCARNSRGCR